MVLITILAVIFYSCSIYDWVNAANNTDKIKPKWNTNIILPVIDKTVVLKDYITNTSFTPDSQNLPVGTAIQTWPQDSIAPPANTLPMPAFSLPFASTVDLNGDGSNDFNLDGVHSDNFKIVMELTLLAPDGTTILDLEPGDISMPPAINIESTTFSIGPAAKSGNELFYNLTDASNSLMFGGDGKIDIGTFDLTLNEVNPADVRYTIGDLTKQFTIKIDVSVYLGNDYGIIGSILSTGTFFSAPFSNIPVDQIPFSSLKNFRIEFNFDSSLSTAFDMHMNFSADNVIPNPSSFDMAVNSGNLSLSSLGYYFVNSSETTDSGVVFEDNVLNYKNFGLDYQINLPNPATGEEILLSTDSTMHIRVNIRADSTITVPTN